MKHTKPEIACEFKVRKVHAYAQNPSFEVLLYTKGRAGWFRLRMSDGARALFTHPPANENEARDVIRKFEETRAA